jgi:hypothetical protein
MATKTETYIADMKAGFPPAPDPIQGIPNLQILIELLFHLCRCAQMHQSFASLTMNLLFCAAPPDVYAFLMTEAYPIHSAPFLPAVANVPNYTTCTNGNGHATVKATHALDKKTRAAIVMMNTTLANVFLDNLSSLVRSPIQQQCLYEPNIVFVDMFV